MAAPAGDERPIVVDDLASLEVEERQMAVYDRPIGLRLIHEDPDSGEEHYLVRYPAGVQGQWHRHTAAHTIVVLEGKLEVNGAVIGPGAYCHFPAGMAMRHLAAGGEPCLLLNLFHGPSDVKGLGDTPPEV
jgi:quercetin dioxygenase-like cupin family protein